MKSKITDIPMSEASIRINPPIQEETEPTPEEIQQVQELMDQSPRLYDPIYPWAAWSMHPLVGYGLLLTLLILWPWMLWSFHGKFHFAIFLLILYLVVPWSGFLHRFLNREGFWLWYIPGLRLLVEGMARLREQYWKLPLTPPLRWRWLVLMLPLDRDIWRERRFLLRGLFLLATPFLLLECAIWIWEYYHLYQPNLSLYHMLVDVKSVAISGMLIFMLFLLLPPLRTLTHFEVAGQSGSGRTIGLVAVVVCCCIFFINWGEEFHSIENLTRLEVRLRVNPGLAKKVDHLAEQFLAQHFRPERFTRFAARNCDEPERNVLTLAEISVPVSIRLTRLFRQQLMQSGLLPRAEIPAYKALAFRGRRSKDQRHVSALLLYYNKGGGLRHWYKVRSSRSNDPTLPIQSDDVKTMYNVLLSHMEVMDLGNQLSLDYDVRSHPHSITYTCKAREGEFQTSPLKIKLDLDKLVAETNQFVQLELNRGREALKRKNARQELQRLRQEALNFAVQPPSLGWLKKPTSQPARERPTTRKWKAPSPRKQKP